MGCAVHRLLFLLPILLLTGCDAGKKAAVAIDLSQLNWQTGVIAALLLWVDKSSLWAPIAKFGQPVVDLLKKIGLLKKSTTPDATPGTLTSAEALQALIELINRTQDGPLRETLLASVPVAASYGVATDGK